LDKTGKAVSRLFPGSFTAVPEQNRMPPFPAGSPPRMKTENSFVSASKNVGFSMTGETR
jgi:hypothetical protein